VRLGLLFDPLGSPIEHHGIRRCIARLADLIERPRDRETVLWPYASRNTYQASSEPHSPDDRREMTTMRARGRVAPSGDGPSLDPGMRSEPVEHDPQAIGQRCFGPETEVFGRVTRIPDRDPHLAGLRRAVTHDELGAA